MAQFRNGTKSAAYGEKLSMGTPLCGHSVRQNQNCVKSILWARKIFLTILLHRGTIELNLNKESGVYEKK